MHFFIGFSDPEEASIRGSIPRVRSNDPPFLFVPHQQDRTGQIKSRARVQFLGAEFWVCDVYDDGVAVRGLDFARIADACNQESTCPLTTNTKRHIGMDVQNSKVQRQNLLFWPGPANPAKGQPALDPVAPVIVKLDSQEVCPSATGSPDAAPHTLNEWTSSGGPRTCRCPFLKTT